MFAKGFSWLLAILVINLAIMLSASGSQDVYQFQQPLMEKRFQHLLKELRCPKCQNQNLADSDAPIAVDLREQIYEMLQQGQSDQEIIDFLVSRYGEFVLYTPKLKGIGYLLWIGPWVILLTVFLVLIVVLYQRRQRLKLSALTPAEQQALAELLAAAQKTKEDKKYKKADNDQET
jgi:cytochrome c-type biogenesis protein CcmH